MSDFYSKENCYCHFSPSVFIHFDFWGDKDEVIISKCCQKSFRENAIEVLSFNEFNAIDDLYGHLSKVFNIEPETWDPVVNPDNCPVPVCHYGKFPYPKLLDVDLSIECHCNLKCSFCGFVSQREKLYKYDLKSLYINALNKFKGTHLRTLYLTSNGEPFFYKEDTLKFLESLTTDDIQNISLHTNGTLLNKTDLERLLSIKPKLYLNFSLNGWDKESYKRINGFDFFDKVIENIEYAHSLVRNEDSLNVSFVLEEESDWECACLFSEAFSQKFSNIDISIQFNINKTDLCKKHPRIHYVNGSA